MRLFLGERTLRAAGWWPVEASSSARPPRHLRSLSTATADWSWRSPAAFVDRTGRRRGDHNGDDRQERPAPDCGCVGVVKPPRRGSKGGRGGRNSRPQRSRCRGSLPIRSPKIFSTRLQLSIFAHTIILIVVARSLPARLCSSCSVSATGLALESRATELELRKSKTPGLLSGGLVSGCSIDLRAAEMG